jgi:signal transduction histidine kinase
MSKEESNSYSPAEQYVADTVSRMQKSVQTTMIVAAVILIVEIAYFSILNNKIAEGLTAIPDMVEAYQDDFNKINDMAGKIPEIGTYSNEIAKAQTILDGINGAEGTTNVAGRITGMIVHEIRTQENMIAQYSSELLQDNLGNLPEWVQAQIPKYSGRLQERTDLWINQFCVASSDELGSTFDTFLESNGDQIRAFSEATDDELALEKLDEELTTQIAVFMGTTSLENYGTLEEQSDRFLSRLKAANELLKPLANKKTEELTEDERQLRRAIGIFMNRVDEVNLNK